MILAEGVSDAGEIDGLWRHMFIDNKITPCKLMDQVGLDTVAFIEDNYINERGLDGKLTVDWLRENYISQGKLGNKTPGKGGLYPPQTSATTASTSSSAAASSAVTPTSAASPASTRPSSIAPSRAADDDQQEPPSLYILDVGLGANLKDISKVATNGKILRLDPSTGKTTALVTGLPAPDGIDVSRATKRMYWTNMGAHPSARDGSVMSASLDGSDVQTLIPSGGVTTPKQLVLVEPTDSIPGHEKGKLYFCDREGMGVHRVNFDGSGHEVLVQNDLSQTGLASLSEWCVGIALDLPRGHLYWTQKGISKANRGRILRCNLEVPEGETAEHRSDVETVFEGLPEPIDLEFDPDTGYLYWTDRGEHPRGCSLNRALVGADGLMGDEGVEILARQFHEPIGLKLDLQRGLVYVTDLGGCVYAVDMHGDWEKKVLYQDDGCYTGIAAFVE